MNVIDILAIAPYYISLGRLRSPHFIHRKLDFFLAFEDVNVSIETGIGDNMTHIVNSDYPHIEEQVNK